LSLLAAIGATGKSIFNVRGVWLDVIVHNAVYMPLIRFEYSLSPKDDDRWGGHWCGIVGGRALLVILRQYRFRRGGGVGLHYFFRAGLPLCPPAGDRVDLAAGETDCPGRLMEPHHVWVGRAQGQRTWLTQA